MFEGSKVYVAGHTGLLGTALVRRLKDTGCELVIRTRSELDLTDGPAVGEFFHTTRPDYVFLAAGVSGGIEANKTRPATFLHSNIAIQDNVFEAAEATKVKHLVFYGSSCMYPKNSPQPIKENYLLKGEIEETSTAYATAKIAGVVGCGSYNTEYGSKRFVALVPNSMYGPSDNFDPDSSHVVAALIRKFHQAKVEGRGEVVLWGSGEPRREFLYSDDVAAASIFAVENAEYLENTHYNVGVGIDYSIKELASTVARVVGYEGRIMWDTERPDGAARKLLDSSRFKKLGWRPETDLHEGLEKTYEWFTREEAEGRTGRKRPSRRAG